MSRAGLASMQNLRRMQRYALSTSGPVSADFTTLTAGVATLPSGWALTRASAATVQTGTSTVDTTPAVDQARAGRRLDADAIGLVIEEARTNSKFDNRDLTSANWLTTGACTITRPYVTGGNAPDGSATTPTRLQVAAGTNIRSGAGTVGVSVPAAMSGWYRATAPGGKYDLCGNIPTSIGTGVQSAADTAWGRLVVNGTSPVGGTITVEAIEARGATNFVGAPTAGAMDGVVDLVQCEKGSFESEVIVTAGASATRAGERLRFTPSQQITAAAQLRFYAKLKPKGAATAYATNLSTIRLWTDANDATSYCEMDTTTRVMTISIAGATNTTAALTWAKFDVLEIWVVAGGSQTTVVKYRVNGGAATVPAITGTALGNFAPSGALDILCDGTGKQWSAWLYNVIFYPSGQQPTWT
jgi:hypothetical protein